MTPATTILFAKHHFIEKHPEWYPGLTNFSSNTEFQAFLHSQKSVDDEAEKKKCPQPCDRDAVEEVQIRATCKTAERNDVCWKSVVWGATEGIRDHAEWYPGLTAESSFEEFQLKVHKDPDTKCPHRPCPCHTHTKADACHQSVVWVMEEGLKKHPKAFEGLSKTSSFVEVQAYLHATRTSSCLRPCIEVPW